MMTQLAWLPVTINGILDLMIVTRSCRPTDLTRSVALVAGRGNPDSHCVRFAEYLALAIRLNARADPNALGPQEPALGSAIPAPNGRACPDRSLISGRAHGRHPVTPPGRARS